MSKKIIFQAKNQRTIFWPILFVCGFVFFRGLLYLNLPGLEYYLRYDEAIYAILSQKLLSGDFASGFHPYWNSGFPLITIPFYLLTRSWENAQTFVSIISHVFLVLAIYLTLKKISIPLALLASFFAAFSPSFTKLVTAGGVTEPLYVLLFWLAVYFGWQAVITKKTRYYAFAGLFFGFSYLTRTEVIYTLSVFLLFTLLSFFLKRRNQLKVNKITLLSILGGIFAYLYIPLTHLPKFTTFKFMTFRSTRGILFAIPFAIAALISIFFERNKTSLVVGIKNLTPKIGILLVVFLFVNLPYIVTISKNIGRFTLSGKYSFIGSSHPFTPEKDRLTSWAQDIWSIDYPNYGSPYYDPSRIFTVMWKYLDHALEATWNRLYTNINFFAHDNVFTDFEATLILFGFIAAILQSRFRKFIFYLFVLWLGSFIFVSHFMDATPRYLAFSFPMFYILQAFAIFSITNLFSKVNPVFLPLTIILFAIWYFDKNFDAKDFASTQRYSMNSDQKVIGEYLKSQGIDLIMARTEGISFYSGAKMVYMPAANPKTIVKFAKAWGVEYLVARPGEASWDYMQPIANPNFKDSDLILKHRFEDGTLIWEVKLTGEEKLHNFRTTQDVNKRFEDINVNSQTILKR